MYHNKCSQKGRLICRWLLMSPKCIPSFYIARHEMCTDAEMQSIDEDIISNKRNKSRLQERHFRKLHKIPTPLSEEESAVFALNRQRKLYATYGKASGINPGILWPSKEEMELDKEWEALAYPNTFQEMVKIAKDKKEEEEKATKKRQEELVARAAQLDQWMRKIRDRIDVNRDKALEAKEKRERLIEAVRQQLGFRVDPKDERFKEALEQKEKEEKKAKRVAKKLQHQQQLLEQYRKAAEDAAASTAQSVTQGQPVLESSQPQTEKK